MEEIEVSKAQLVILNGIWRDVLNPRMVVRHLAVTRHLVVADDSFPHLDEFSQDRTLQSEVMIVSQIQGKQGLIHIEFRRAMQA